LKMALEIVLENDVGKQDWKPTFENSVGKQH
jgi:hypothetical protein